MADDIIPSLEIIEKLLFPETDFWHDNYLKSNKTWLKQTKFAWLNQPNICLGEGLMYIE